MDNKTALIIDDSATARSVLKHQLTKLGLEVLSAESGESALQLLKTDHPDVIFLDHVMPGMDGFEVLESLKNQDSTESIPVIMYTSQAATSYAQKAKSLGALGVLPKQVNAERVRLILDRTKLFKTSEPPQTLEPVVLTDPAVSSETNPSNSLHNQAASPSLAGRPRASSTPTTDELYEQRKLSSTHQELDHTGIDEDSGTSRNTTSTPPDLGATVPQTVSSTAKANTTPVFSALNLLVLALLISQLYWIAQTLEQQQKNNRLEAKLEHYQQQNTVSLEKIQQLQQASQNTNDEIYFVLETLISKVLEPPAIASSASSADNPGDINDTDTGDINSDALQDNTESSPSDSITEDGNQSDQIHSRSGASAENQAGQTDLQSEEEDKVIE
jgi:CheY-like chemotaxis protein